MTRQTRLNNPLRQRHHIQNLQPLHANPAHHLRAPRLRLLHQPAEPTPVLQRALLPFTSRPAHLSAAVADRVSEVGLRAVTCHVALVAHPGFVGCVDAGDAGLGAGREVVGGGGGGAEGVLGGEVGEGTEWVGGWAGDGEGEGEEEGVDGGGEGEGGREEEEDGG